MIDLAPPRFSLLLLWPYLLCFARHRYKFWFWKVQTGIPQGGRLIPQQSRYRVRPAETSPASFKTREEECGKRRDWRCKRAKERNSCGVDQPGRLINSSSTAVLRDGPQFGLLWTHLWMPVINTVDDALNINLNENIEMKYERVYTPASNNYFNCINLFNVASSYHPRTVFFSSSFTL